MVLFGSDHGAGACPVGLKLNLSSPQERKERGELNFRCPTLQIASIDCSKDSFELLTNTVMPQTKGQMAQLRNSFALLVFSVREPTKCHKVFLIPKSRDMCSVHVSVDQLVCRVGPNQRSIGLTGCFATDDGIAVPFHDFRVTAIISNFNDLHVGDLAFLAVAIGMNDSAGAHCVHCFLPASKFNCETIHPQDIQTKASLTTELNVCMNQRWRKSVNNEHGVNCVGFLDIDPQRTMAPMPHCPMGLVDEALVNFEAWAGWCSTLKESMTTRSHLSLIHI